MFQSLNGYNRAALAEAVFDVENELFNEGRIVRVHDLEINSLPHKQNIVLKSNIIWLADVHQYWTQWVN